MGVLRVHLANAIGWQLYLEDQTDALVSSIQSLVASIRAEDAMPTIRNRLTDIASVVGNVVSATQSFGQKSSSISTSLADKAAATVQTLTECKSKLLHASEDSKRLDGSSDKGAVKGFTQRLPPLAFEVARETKELVQKIETVSAGDASGDDFA